ncbi:hypothetical protein C0J52_27849 [Blattella germanica]|nr:hypothetical protein C0J52_27849 [Blattella germanica]
MSGTIFLRSLSNFYKFWNKNLYLNQQFSGNNRSSPLFSLSLFSSSLLLIKDLVLF